MTLIEAFDQVVDPRRGQGLRVTLGQVFSMVVISNLCGHLGYRPVHTFSQAHRDLFIAELGLRHGIPSHVTFRDVLMRTDQGELIAAFNGWAKCYSPVSQGDWVSADGKALGSTLTDAFSRKQDFQAVVSFFCQQSGLVRLIGEYRNAKKSEAEVVRSLLEHLRDSGAIIRLDALHTQKKRSA